VSDISWQEPKGSVWARASDGYTKPTSKPAITKTQPAPLTQSRGRAREHPLKRIASVKRERNFLAIGYS